MMCGIVDSEHFKPCLNCKKTKDRIEFHSSKEWKDLKVKVFEIYSKECMKCGKSDMTAGTSIQVDHVKPRIKYPELSLDINNMQILCRKCNFKKGSTDETDYRT
jgi:5-methylcytosine-specific restriction endonuclease McrA